MFLRPWPFLNSDNDLDIAQFYNYFFFSGGELKIDDRLAGWGSLKNDIWIPYSRPPCNFYES